VGYKRFKVSPPRKTTETPLMATALQYDPEQDSAPKVIASGQRKIAEQILAEARKHNIPVYEDPALTTALAGVDLGAEIPVELYQVVAEVLAYIYRVTNRYSKQ
jgi:flagellar biosynthesis protein